MTDVRRDPRDIALDVFARIGWFDIGKNRRGEHYVCVDDTVTMTADERAALVEVMTPRWEAAYEEADAPKQGPRVGLNWAQQQREERIAAWPQPSDRRHR